MGYALCIGSCYGCNRTITFNPARVPSVRDRNGTKQPLCGICVKVMQEKQKDQGVPIWPDPLPDAYEACPEEELC